MNEAMKERANERTNKQTESLPVLARWLVIPAMPCHASFQQQASNDGDTEASGKGSASTFQQIARVILLCASPNGSIDLFI
jgi:hypothetical protein